MKALVVYESMFGNTGRIARAVADGLATSMEAEACDVRRLGATLPDDVDLLVLGAPTHAFSLSRPSTRADAMRQGAPPQDPSVGLREWIAEQSLAGRTVAVFDSRAAKARHLPGSAARSAARMLRRRGVARPLGVTSFYVADVAGPLVDGELDRAAAWGRELAGLMQGAVSA